MSAETNALANRRILVVEDEVLIAMQIEEILLDLGCVVVGAVGRLDAALELAADQALDAAILDVNILGGLVYPVAERLSARGIPFMLASGYSNWALPEPLRDLPRLMKPFRRRELEDGVRSLCRPH